MAKRIKTRRQQTDNTGARREKGKREKGQRMSDHELVAFLGRKIEQSMNDDGDDISATRQENFNYFRGAEYGNERTGYSKFVTRETLETVEWVLPAALRVFLADSKVVTFDATGPDDDAAAEQETDITNHFVMKAPDSFVAFYSWFKDALMYPNAYMKCYIDERTTVDIDTLTGLDALALLEVQEDPDAEITEQTSYIEAVEQIVPGPQGPQTQTVEEEFFDLKVKYTRTERKLVIEAVPGEEVLVDNDLTHPDLDKADFVCHRCKKNYTQLVEMGLDAKKLDEIGTTSTDGEWNDERTNRLFYSDENPDAADEDDPAMREYWVHECYVMVDYDGDGLAEHRKILMVADKVFMNYECNYQPMVNLSAILMQHKHTGMSYVELVKDLQLLLSTLTRQLLDNIYRNNIRRKVFSEDALTDDGATMDAMLNAQSEFIPVRGPATNAFVPEPLHSMVAEILPVIQHFDKARAMRTGVSPETALDPNVIRESTYGAFMEGLEQASQRVEMLVRVFAETGMRRLMLKAHHQLRTHQDKPRTLKLRGQWVPVDPSGWRERNDMTVNVGLGFNSKQMMLNLLSQLLMVQKEAVPAGLAKLEHIYNTLRRLVEYSGVGDVRNYFVDPTSDEFQPPQPQPNPQVILATAQAEALKAEQQRKGVEAQQKGQHQQAQLMLEHKTKQEELAAKAADREFQAEKLAFEKIRFMHEFKLSERELDAKIRNMRADTVAKLASADKSSADAVASMVNSSETYAKAQKITEERKQEEAEGESDDSLAPDGKDD